ncbi:hypothetical protein B0H14DRAFT_3737038 [Mycena olivaceomarginata]|nr:hypothetical protein B0H14DRAFT_3737038 [Mycena olivaceomarginata]
MENPIPVVPPTLSPLHIAFADGPISKCQKSCHSSKYHHRCSYPAKDGAPRPHPAPRKFVIHGLQLASCKHYFCGACLAHHIYCCLNLVFDTARYGTVVKTPAAATPGRRVEFPISCPTCQVKPGKQPVEISDMTARLVLGEANMDEWNHAWFPSTLNLIYWFRIKGAICGVLLETIALPLTNTDAEETQTTCECKGRRHTPVLPRLEEACLFGLAGERMHRLMAFRAGFAEGCGGGSGCPAECAESLPSSACSSDSSSAPWSPEDSTPTSSCIIIEVDFGPSRCGRAARFVVRWSARRCVHDVVLEQLVRQGRIECVDEDDEAVNEDYNSSECGDELNWPSDEEEESRRGLGGRSRGQFVHSSIASDSARFTLPTV